MDLIGALRSTRSKADARSIQDWVGDDTVKFGLLMDIVLKGEGSAQQKGAWVLTTICDVSPDIAQPYLKDILDTIERPGLHQGVYRSLIRLFQKCTLPESLHGRIASIMFSVCTDPNRSIAEHAFAIHVGVRMVKAYPELAGEFKLILDECSELDSSAGVRSSVRKARTALEKINMQPPSGP
jgi:hypothetical protein